MNSLVEEMQTYYGHRAMTSPWAMTIAKRWMH